MFFLTFCVCVLLLETTLVSWIICLYLIDWETYVWCTVFISGFFTNTIIVNSPHNFTAPLCCCCTVFKYTFIQVHDYVASKSKHFNSQIILANRPTLYQNVRFYRDFSCMLRSPTPKSLFYILLLRNIKTALGVLFLFRKLCWNFSKPCHHCFTNAY